MKRGLLYTLVTVAIVLLCGQVSAYAPLIGPIPDVWIGDKEDNPISPPPDLNVFVFTDAFNFDIYADHDPLDPDQSTTNIRWSFYSEEEFVTINGISRLSDPSEAIQPDGVGKELTSYPNNDPTFPRPTSWATFYDLVDSPPASGPPWSAPGTYPGSPLNDEITIYASNGAKASSRTIMVVANVGTPDAPDALSGGIETVWTYDEPANEGWIKSMPVADGFMIDNFGNPFYIGPHSSSTVDGWVAGSGDDPEQRYSAWESPATDIDYVANKVYRVKYTIRSSQTDVTTVPNLRLMTDYVGTGVLAFTAGNRIGRGLFAPLVGGSEYSVYSQAPDLTGTGVTNAKVKFEVIDFAPEEIGTNYLEKVVVERFDVPAGGTLVKSFTPGNFTGWTPTTIGGIFGVATVGSDVNGLYIQTGVTPGGTQSLDYGAWSLGAGTSAESFEAGRLYRCVYTLQSTATTLGKIRLLNQNGANDWISKACLLSDQTTLHYPDSDGEMYSNWYETMPALYGDASKNKMGYTYDVADGSPAQSGRGTLTKVELYYYSIP
jgi:hypothetical protein